jgi:enoyl-CoA hydratase
MPDEPILLTRPRPQVALITFNEPKTLNAMSPDMVSQLRSTLTDVDADPTIRVVILTGAGRGFCSGHGLNELGKANERTDPVRMSLANQRGFSQLIIKINELRAPVIAAVNGPAAGAGLAMALAADTRVCSESARFGAAFIRVGISGCDVGVSYLLPRLVGPTLAFEMMLTGRLADADEALRTGLVLRVVPDGEVVDAALTIADQILGNSPFSVELTKRGMWQALGAPSLRHVIETEDRTQVLCMQVGDSPRAIAALRAKETVDWSKPA